jgi:hypothetical protein
MAKDFNQLLFEIRIGNDAVLRKTNSGKSVLNFGGANHATSDKDRDPLWIAFRAWEKLAETIAPQMTKGRKIFGQGHIPVLPAPHKYATRNGAEVYLSKDAKDTMKKVIALLRSGDPKVANDDKVVALMTNLHSSQVVIDVDKMRYGDERGLEGRAETSDDIDLDSTTPDDDIPF